MRFSWSILVLILVCQQATCGNPTPDIQSLMADRRAVERVYYDHRLGIKPPFEESLTPDLLERKVHLELHKERVLKRQYGTVVTPAEVEAEVTRIRQSTRAPDMLAEIMSALDDNPVRFACTVARPLVVERRLRSLFDNDEKLHSAMRHKAEAIRHAFLTSQDTSSIHRRAPHPFEQDPAISARVITWNLSSRQSLEADEDEFPRQHQSIGNQEVISPLASSKLEDVFFEDLPEDLRRVLKVQLTQPGAVSAVIEMPLGFLVYRAESVSAGALAALAVMIPKRSYDQWLQEQYTNVSGEQREP